MNKLDFGVLLVVENGTENFLFGLFDVLSHFTEDLILELVQIARREVRFSGSPCSAWRGGIQSTVARWQSRCRVHFRRAFIRRVVVTD